MLPLVPLPMLPPRPPLLPAPMPLPPCMPMEEPPEPDCARDRLWAFSWSAMLSEEVSDDCFVALPRWCLWPAASAGMVAKASVAAAAAARKPESRILVISLFCCRGIAAPDAADAAWRELGPGRALRMPGPAHAAGSAPGRNGSAQARF